MTKYKINRDHNIGSVIFILEGSKTEFDLLEKIFVNILGYQLEQLRRTKGYILRGKNPYSKIIAINFEGNHLFDINPDEQDRLFAKIIDLGVKPENSPIYYLYDRDVKSYEIDEVRTFVERYQDPYGTIEGDQGQLLLSYPAIESYTVSCFCDNTYKHTIELGKDLKQFAAQNSYTLQMLRTEDHILHATNEMNTALTACGIDSYDLDSLGETLLALYDSQQQVYLRTKEFNLLSTLSFVLLELGIIEVDE